MSDNFFVVGLGNPGPEYLFTRHNAGFMVLDLIQRIHNLRFCKFGQMPALKAEKQFGEKKVNLIKPLTFMNRSGQVVKSLDLEQNEDGEVSNLLVVFDDVYIPFGTIRLRKSGGYGGHNGIKSIIDSIQTEKFHRLRIGIGTDNPVADLHSFVLGNFNNAEREVLSDILLAANDSIEWYLAHGIDSAMSKFNGKVI